MNIRKIATITIALLINCAAIAAFLAWSASAAASAAAHAVHTENVINLAPINVYPSAAAVHALRHTRTGND